MWHQGLVMTLLHLAQHREDLLGQELCFLGRTQSPSPLQILFCPPTGALNATGQEGGPWTPQYEVAASPK